MMRHASGKSARAITGGIAVGEYSGQGATVGLAFDLDANVVVPYALDGLAVRFR